MKRLFNPDTLNRDGNGDGNGNGNGDFSPSNAMKDKQGSITLIDFSHAGRTGANVPPYIRRQGYQSDIFETEYDWSLFDRYYST